jgi:hypothetical protein
MADVGTATASTTGRLAGHGREVVRRDARVLRECSSGAPAEHLIARLQISDVLADGCHHAGQVPAGDGVAWPTQTKRQPHDARHAGHHEVVAGMDRSGADADQDVAVPHDRPAHIGVLEHLGRPVATLHDRPHPARLGRVSYADRALARVLRSLLW